MKIAKNKNNKQEIVYSLNDILKFTDSKYSVYLQNKLLLNEINNTPYTEVYQEEKYQPSALEKIMQQSGVLYEGYRTDSYIKEQFFLRDIFNNISLMNQLKLAIQETGYNIKTITEFVEGIHDSLLKVSINRKQVTLDDEIKIKKNIRIKLIKVLMNQPLTKLIERYHLYRNNDDIVKYKIVKNISLEKNKHIQIDNEMAINENVKSSFVAFIEDPGANYEISNKLTLKLMELGVAIIVQGVLKYTETDISVIGISDLVVKVPCPRDYDNNKVFSTINNKKVDYMYEIKDIKRSHVDKPKFVLQNCCYSDMIYEMQKNRPIFGEILLGNNDSDIFRVSDFMSYYKYILKDFIKLIQHKEYKPEIQDFSNKRSIEYKYTNALEAIPNISNKEILILNKNCIFTIEELLMKQKCEGLSLSTLNRLKEQSKLSNVYKKKIKLDISIGGQSTCLISKRIFYNKFINNKYKVLPQYKNEQYNLKNLPQFTNEDIILDIKFTDSLDKEGFICFYNWLYIENGLLKTEQIECYSKNKEHVFLSLFMTKIFKKLGKTGKIYTYKENIINVLLESCCKYSIYDSFVYSLILDNKIVSLFNFVLNNVVIESSEINLYTLSRFINHNIPNNIIYESLGVSFESPLLSIINYPKSKEERENKEVYKHKLKEVADYKIQFEYLLYIWLKQLANKAILANEIEELYDIIEDNETNFHIDDEKPKTKKKDKQNEKNKDEIIEIKDRQRFSQKDFLKMGQQEKVKLLISQLTQFHNVENKVTLIDKNYVELNLANNVSNLNCLNNILPVKQQKTQKKHYITYKINNFDESKIIKGDRIKVIGEKTYAKVMFNDGKNITLEFSKEYKLEKISIVKQNSISFDKIVDELYKIHNKVDLGLPYIGLNKCVYDFLMKKEPEFNNGYFRKDDSDELGANVIEEGTRAISNLNNSFIIIQGPPGTGKSFTSSHIIINLIKQAKLDKRQLKIGVSSNSHKAIDGLLLKIRQESLSRDEKIDIYKYHSKTNDNTELYKNEIYDVEDMTSSIAVIGGTVFNMFKEKLDYLFIDEAGQVSLANMVVMASQSDNLILIGDQQQLEQPIQGIHSGDSGKSVLEYYLDGVAVVPFRKGFFLPISRRMCKELCETVSSFFYNGQLFSEEDLNELEDRIFEFPLKIHFKDNTLNLKKRGVQFIEVNHKNNLSSSDEEVEKIIEIVDFLITQKIEEKGVLRDIKLEDIIIVSPFNSQVNKIAKAIPKCNTGSVDLFQGQEAPIVIYSLAASDPSSRGTEFLLNPNRTNVALSRGKLLAIIVGSTEVLNSKPTTIEELKLLNMYSKLVKY